MLYTKFCVSPRNTLMYKVYVVLPLTELRVNGNTYLSLAKTPQVSNQLLVFLGPAPL